MPLGVVTGVDRGIMGILDGGGDRRKERQLWGEFGASHCNQWGLDFGKSASLSHNYTTNYFGDDLLF